MLVGFSQGAGLVSTLSLRRPELVCAVALLAGFIPRTVLKTYGAVAKEVRERRAIMPKYFIAHGTKDEILPPSRASESQVALEGFGAEVKLHLEDVGHKVGSKGMKAFQSWINEVLS